MIDNVSSEASTVFVCKNIILMGILPCPNVVVEKLDPLAFCTGKNHYLPLALLHPKFMDILIGIVL
jgi:hypothetical protein